MPRPRLMMIFKMKLLFHKKGQDEIHPALYSSRLMVDTPLPKDDIRISLFRNIVKSGKSAGKNRFENLLSASEDDAGRNFYYKSASKSLGQCQKEPGVSSLPLFTSLFKKSDTVNHKPDSKYTKSYSKRQGHIIDPFFFGDHVGFRLGHNVFPFVERQDDL